MSCKILGGRGVHASSNKEAVVRLEGACQVSGADKWYMENVHSWSGEMSRIMSEEFAYVPAKSVEYVARFDEAMGEIRKKYENDPVVDNVLTKMNSRRMMRDNDLMGTSPAGLLAMLWFDFVVPNECYCHFKCTLADMGLTCVQGDTHRLFSTLVALARQKK